MSSGKEGKLMNSNSFKVNFMTKIIINGDL